LLKYPHSQLSVNRKMLIKKFLLDKVSIIDDEIERKEA